MSKFTREGDTVRRERGGEGGGRSRGQGGRFGLGKVLRTLLTAREKGQGYYY
jgi:hypothetical protein